MPNKLIEDLKIMKDKEEEFIKDEIDIWSTEYNKVDNMREVLVYKKPGIVIKNRIEYL